MGRHPLDSDVMQASYQDDNAVLGFDATDAALWMFSPFNATLRMIQQRQEEANRQPTDTVRDYTQSAAYRNLLAQGTEADRRGAEADKSLVDAARRLVAIRSAPSQSSAPIAVEVPSFAIGGDLFEDEE